MALIYPKDVETYTLPVCLAAVISELKEVVQEGIYDARSQSVIQVRIRANLGDNLGNLHFQTVYTLFSHPKYSFGIGI